MARRLVWSVKGKRMQPERVRAVRKVLHDAVNRWGKDIDEDLPIDGAEAVEWLGTFVKRASAALRGR